MKPSLAKLVLVLLGGALVWVPLDAADSGSVIAALKGSEILLLDAAGKVTTLAGDPREKWNLRWLPDGTRLSYFVAGSETTDAGALVRFVMPHWPKLVLSDLNGRVTRELPLAPAANSSNPESIRAIEEFEWLSDRFAKLSGSFGPHNCPVFFLDLVAGRTFDERDIVCGSTFTMSPDQQHVAYNGILGGGDWGDLEIDYGPLIYANGPGRPTPPMPPSIGPAAISYRGATSRGMHIEAGPVWSEDSQRIAILEREMPDMDGPYENPLQPRYGQMSLTTISVRGERVTVPVPYSTRDNPALTWVGTRVAVGSGDGALIVDPATKTFAPLDAASAAAAQTTVRSAQKASEDRRRIQDVLTRLGAREGVAKPE